MDFTSIVDLLVFQDAVFTMLRDSNADGRVAARQFRLGSAAADADNVLVYNSATGQPAEEAVTP